MFDRKIKTNQMKISSFKKTKTLTWSDVCNHYIYVQQMFPVAPCHLVNYIQCVYHSAVLHLDCTVGPKWTHHILCSQNCQVQLQAAMWISTSWHANRSRLNKNVKNKTISVHTPGRLFPVLPPPLSPLSICSLLNIPTIKTSLLNFWLMITTACSLERTSSQNRWTAFTQAPFRGTWVV